MTGLMCFVKVKANLTIWDLAGLFGALKSLKASLRSLGSDLLIMEGEAAEVIPSLAALHSADAIIAEEEVEYR